MSLAFLGPPTHVSKNCHFLTPPTHLFADVILEWPLTFSTIKVGTFWEAHKIGKNHMAFSEYMNFTTYLYLRSVEVHCNDMISTSCAKHIGYQFCADRSSGLVFLVLARIGKVRHHCSHLRGWSCFTSTEKWLRISSIHLHHLEICSVLNYFSINRGWVKKKYTNSLKPGGNILGQSASKCKNKLFIIK